MTLHIIDKKKIDLTDDEWAMYQRIVASYTKLPYQKGEDFFIDLFETDADGLIVFLKPPSQRQVSLEIFLFCMSVMQHQHLRSMQKQMSNLCKKVEEKLSKLG
jgi:hypothetical protein